MHAETTFEPCMHSSYVFILRMLLKSEWYVYLLFDAYEDNTAGYCMSVLYFHSPAARENMAAHSCNTHPSNNVYICVSYVLHMFLTL